MINLPIYGNSLNDYPKIIEIEGDTLYLLNEENIDSILFSYTLLDELKRQIQISNDIIDEFKRKDVLYEDKINILETKSSFQDSIINNFDYKLIINEEKFDQKEKEYKKKIRNRNIISISLFILFILSVL